MNLESLEGKKISIIYDQIRWEEKKIYDFGEFSLGNDEVRKLDKDFK